MKQKLGKLKQETQVGNVNTPLTGICKTKRKKYGYIRRLDQYYQPLSVDI